MIGGILKVAEPAPGIYTLIEPFDSSTEVYDRVLFIGIQGGFSLPGVGGLTIRLALSELGPVGVFVNVEVPGGILLEPTTGLSVNDFTAGVEFFKTLPSIEDPLLLRDPAFEVSTTVTASRPMAAKSTTRCPARFAVRNNPTVNGRSKLTISAKSLGFFVSAPSFPMSRS